MHTLYADLKKKLLSLHNWTKNIIGIFHVKCSVSYKKRQKNLLNVSQKMLYISNKVNAFLIKLCRVILTGFKQSIHISTWNIMAMNMYG